MRIINLILGEGEPAFVYKDPGMIVYSLSRYCNYEGTHAFINKTYCNKDFEEWVKIQSIGSADVLDKKSSIEIAKEFLKKEIKNYDIVFLFNYGSTTYKIAYYCKKYNPDIKVWCKLDMGRGGFSHFYEDSVVRKTKNLFERLKSKYVDLFTVETPYYYDKLKDNAMFSGGRLRYLPNGVSRRGINQTALDSIKKENIVLTVGRLGIYEKNNELLLESIARMSPHTLADWKVYFVGPLEPEFEKWVEQYFEKYPELKEKVIFTGNIADRQELYSLYARSKIICMTSRTESFCIATIEGMYNGCVPVLTNYGSIVADQTDNGRLGAVVPVEDVDKLTETLECYMHDENRLAELGEQCKVYARNKYSYEKIATTLDGYFKELR